MHSFLITGADQETRISSTLSHLSESLKIAIPELEKHPDVFQLKGEGSYTINAIRELKRWISQKPFQAKTKGVAIIEAQNLSLPAQNALLKTLEEPPGNTIIILTAPNPSLLLPTIVSRCQIVSLKTPSLKKADPDTLALITKLTSMSPGERISQARELGTSRDHAISFCQNLLLVLRHSLRRGEINQPRALKQTAIALTRLKKNTNPQLTLEHLFLHL